MSIMSLKPCEITADTSRRIRTMNFICACMVVMIHASVFPPSGTIDWWVVLFVGTKGVCRIAVPCFFLMSGYLLVGRSNSLGWYKYAVVSRLKSLLIPFYAWMLVTVLVMSMLRLGIYILKYDFHGNTMLMPECTVSYLMSILGLNPFRDIGPLWFLRSLFLFVLISPVVLRIVKSGCRWILWTVLLTFVCCLRFGLVDNPAMRTCFSFFIPPEGLLYFSIGIFLRIHAPFRSWCTHRWKIYVTAIALLVLKGILSTCDLAHGVGIIDIVSTPVIMLACWNLAGHIRVSREISSFSFPVYLLHGLILLFVTSAYAVIGLSEYAMSSVLAMFVKFVIALIGSVIVAFILIKMFPAFSSVLFGGRK